MHYSGGILTKYLQNERGIGNRTVNVHIAQFHHLWQYVLKRDWDKYEVPFLRYDGKLSIVPTRKGINVIIDPIPNIKAAIEEKTFSIKIHK